MKPVRLLQIDAFAAEPFRGNPAGVCLLHGEASEEWMQALAAEMNVSETAFILSRGAGEFGIRWFTPTTEVPLCGHATLASAHALWSEGLVAGSDPIAFRGRSGRLAARRERDWIALDFPLLVARETTAPPGLVEALGAQPRGVYRNDHSDWLAELESEAAVRQLHPDPGALRRAGVDACMVTAAGGSGQCDFVSRFFAPGLGIDEDPVTGSAHCTLAPFWGARLGRREMVGHQVSRRGGVVKVRLKAERVEILGQALTVFATDLQVAPAPQVG